VDLQLLKLQAQGKTDIGRVRSVNQDSFAVDEQHRIYIVADGMGGHAGGEIASKLCIECIRQYVQTNSTFFQDKSDRIHPDGKITETLSSGINFASMKIYERALEEPALKGMGTTATALSFADNYAYCAHVGDSRLYLFRCGFIYQLTSDHSLVNEQIQAGILSREEAKYHHLRNVITRSVGFQEFEDVDTYFLAVEPGDIFLICSDGLTGKVDDISIAQQLREKGLEAISPLIQMANDKGGDDNITIVLVEVQARTPE
jgi:protein phosphatase